MKYYGILLLSILLLSVSAAQDRSNSEVKRDFEKGYKALLKSINDAGTTDQIAAVGDKVKAFDAEYRSYRDFLNKALYPDDFDASMEKLNAQFAYSEQKIRMIGESAARIAELELQVTALTAEVNKLSGENASLLAQLREAKAERDELKKVVATLRGNLAKRDKALFALVDSLFMQYDKNIQHTGDVQKSKQSKLEKSSVLTNIKQAVSDNVEFLSSTLLSGPDVAKLFAEQRKFESRWNGVKGLLADAYLSNKEKAREIPMIDTMIMEWRTKVDESFWKALNGQFSAAQLAVAPIMSGSDVYPMIARFMDEQINGTGPKSEMDPYTIYLAFEKLWTEELKPVWMPIMKENNIVTDANVADIDTKLQLWFAKVKPSNWLLYTLIGLVVLAVGYILYSRMKPKQAVA